MHCAQLKQSVGNAKQVKTGLLYGKIIARGLIYLYTSRVVTISHFYHA